MTSPANEVVHDPISGDLKKVSGREVAIADDDRSEDDRTVGGVEEPQTGGSVHNVRS